MAEPARVSQTVVLALVEDPTFFPPATSAELNPYINFPLRS
jgi:hypothetical protein